MKRVPKIASLFVLTLFILGIGFFIGHRIGRTYGAQQYTKKLWATNEMQLSSDEIFKKINTYREEKGLSPLEESLGLCRLARHRAAEARRTFGSKWDVQKQQYKDIESESELHKTELTGEKIKELCPECILESLDANVYISLRPEPCLSPGDKEKICIGNEEFGLLENYTNRVINAWVGSPEHNELLLSPMKYGCVGSYGGTVILEVAEVEE